MEFQPFDDPEYNGKVELSLTEAKTRRSSIGSINYCLALSLMESKYI